MGQARPEDAHAEGVAVAREAVARKRLRSTTLRGTSTRLGSGLAGRRPAVGTGRPVPRILEVVASSVGGGALGDVAVWVGFVALCAGSRLPRGGRGPASHPGGEAFGGAVGGSGARWPSGLGPPTVPGRRSDGCRPPGSRISVRVASRMSVVAGRQRGRRLLARVVGFVIVRPSAVVSPSRVMVSGLAAVGCAGSSREACPAVRVCSRSGHRMPAY